MNCLSLGRMAQYGPAKNIVLFTPPLTTVQNGHNQGYFIFKVIVWLWGDLPKATSKDSPSLGEPWE